MTIKPSGNNRNGSYEKTVVQTDAGSVQVVVDDRVASGLPAHLSERAGIFPFMAPSEKASHWIAVLRSSRHGGWHRPGDEDSDSPLGGRRPRDLLFAVDVDTYPQRETVATQVFESIVKDSGPIAALTISDSGPPRDGRGHREFARGWVATSVDEVPVRDIGGSYRFHREGGGDGEGVFLGEQLRAAYDWGWTESVYAPLGGEVARRKLVSDVAMAEAAKRVGCHILVSDREQFYTGDHITRLVDMRVCRIPQAVAIASLHLRLSGTFTPWRVPGARADTTRTGFYLQSALALLPEWWRLLANIPDNRAGSLVDLALGIPRRVAKALRIRDECLALVSYRPTDTVFELLGEEIESLATALKGAFDSLAETCNEMWGGGLRRYEIGVQTKPFRTALRERGGAEAVAWLEDKSTRSYATLQLVTELRNAVHRNPLHGVAYRTRPYDPASTMYPLPSGLQRDELERTIQLLGGRPHEQSNASHRYVVHPEDLIDVITAESCDALNGLMQQLPLTVLDVEKPYGPISDYRLSDFGVEQLALQLGLRRDQFRPPGLPRTPTPLLAN